MTSLLARLPGASKTEAIERAIAAYLARDAIDELRSMAGTVEIEDLSSTLRERDRTS